MKNVRNFKSKPKTQFNKKVENIFKTGVEAKKLDKKATANKQKTLTQKASKLHRKKILVKSLSRNKISNFNKTSALKRKCQNKVKTLQISPHSTKILAQEQIFYSLACAKASSDPQANLKLYQIISKALKENIAWPSIESVLQQNNKPKIGKNCFLLELKFKKKIFVLLSLRSAYFHTLRKILKMIWQKYNFSNSSVLQHFHYNCLIEALAPYPTARDFAVFEKNLSKDAVNCRVKGVGIMDYETGAVYFQCDPLQLAGIVEHLERRNYKILFTNYGFQPIERVFLDDKERQQYKMLVSELLKFKEIEQFYDNLDESENHI